MQRCVSLLAGNRFNVLGGATLALTCGVGCSSVDDVPKAQVEPAAAAARAIELYDANSDGAIELAECDSVLGLQSVFPDYDSNGDGKLTAEELEAGIAAWSARGGGPIVVEVQVLSGPRAVSNATVKLQPVPFLADELPEAEGVTDAQGISRMHASDFPFPESLQRERFMFPGLYNVHVSLPNQSKELTPVGAALDNTAMASRALKIEVSPNGTAKIIQAPQ